MIVMGWFGGGICAGRRGDGAGKVVNDEKSHPSSHPKEGNGPHYRTLRIGQIFHVSGKPGPPYFGNTFMHVRVRVCTRLDEIIQ
jgi:hypothetical protein